LRRPPIHFHLFLDLLLKRVQPAEVGLQAHGVDPLSGIRLNTWLGQPAQPMPHRVSTSARLFFPHTLIRNLRSQNRRQLIKSFPPKAR
jgi:hypothetical protein